MITLHDGSTITATWHSGTAYWSFVPPRYEALVAERGPMRIAIVECGHGSHQVAARMLERAARAGQ